MSEPELRASDADREGTADRLRRAAGEGRLSADELEERLEAAFAARTAGELAPLVADLPPDAIGRAPRGGPARRHHGCRAHRRAGRPGGRGELRSWAATSILLVAIWALTGAGYFWPIWPILGWGVFTVAPLVPSPLRGTLPACRRNASSRLSTSR
jgi:Domain of unknown function (DUF1707)